jgi:hypothetical protein
MAALGGSNGVRMIHHASMMWTAGRPHILLLLLTGVVAAMAARAPPGCCWAAVAAPGWQQLAVMAAASNSCSSSRWSPLAGAWAGVVRCRRWVGGPATTAAAEVPASKMWRLRATAAVAEVRQILGMGVCGSLLALPAQAGGWCFHRCRLQRGRRPGVEVEVEVGCVLVERVGH